MKLSLICEDTIGAILRRFLLFVKGKPGFGPGVNPKNFQEVKEIIDVRGIPRINVDREWNKALELENQAKILDDNLLKEKAEITKKALDIYKSFADAHYLTGLRQKSYFKRSEEAKKDEFENHLFVVVDIDNMKFINSKLGHAGADSVIVKFGELFKKYLEININNKFGNISKVYHRSGDEFNVIISLYMSKNKNDVIYFVHGQCKQLINEFVSIVFKGKDENEKLNQIRATITIGIGFNEESVDMKVDELKIQRRRKLQTLISPLQRKEYKEMSHLILDDKIKKIIENYHL